MTTPFLTDTKIRLGVPTRLASVLTDFPSLSTESVSRTAAFLSRATELPCVSNGDLKQAIDFL